MYRQSFKSYRPLNIQKELSPIDTQITERFIDQLLFHFLFHRNFKLSLKSVIKKGLPEILIMDIL